MTGLWPGLGAPALGRGYNALVFDGPGQQSMLFERHVSFRPDWEHVITPIVDFLLQRPEVDANRLALYGISQAGYWVPRALAFGPKKLVPFTKAEGADMHCEPMARSLLEQRMFDWPE